MSANKECVCLKKVEEEQTQVIQHLINNDVKKIKDIIEATVLSKKYTIRQWFEFLIICGTEILYDENLDSESKGRIALNSFSIVHGLSKSNKQKKQIMPLLADAFFEVGKGYFQKGNFEEAIIAFKGSRKINPKDSGLVTLLGIAYYKNGNFGEAIIEFKKTLDLNPKNPDIYALLGLALDELGNFPEAIEAFKESLKLNPNKSDIHHFLGTSFAKNGNSKEAVEELKKSLELEPNSPDIHFNLGLVYLIFSDFTKAKNELDIAEESYRKINDKKAEIKSNAFSSVASGRENWFNNNLSSAQRLYQSAAKSFDVIKEKEMAIFLYSISDFFSADKEMFLSIEQSTDFNELKENMVKIRKQIDTIKLLAEDNVIADEVEIILTKRDFIDVLINALEFKDPDFEKIQKIKNTLRMKGYFSAYHAINALDSFVVEISQFNLIKKIDKEKQKLLLSLLNRRGGTLIDGSFTQEASEQILNKKIVNELVQTIREIRTDQKSLLQDMEELKVLNHEILTIVKENPEKVKALIETELDELKQIFFDIEKKLEGIDPQKASKAKEWYDKLVDGISIAADIVQIFTFLTGIPSLPAMTHTEIPNRVTSFFEKIKHLWLTR